MEYVVLSVKQSMEGVVSMEGVSINSIQFNAFHFISFHFTIRYDRIHTISSLILIRREGMKKDSVELIHRERHDYEWLGVKCCDPMERIEGL